MAKVTSNALTLTSVYSRMIPWISILFCQRAARPGKADKDSNNRSHTTMPSRTHGRRLAQCIRTFPAMHHQKPTQLQLHQLNTPLPKEYHTTNAVDNGILQTLQLCKYMQEYKIEWIRKPFQVYPVVTSAVISREASLVMEEEVKSLLQKQAAIVIPTCEDHFISQLFQ